MKRLVSLYFLTTFALAILVSVAGCQKNQPPAPQAPSPSQPVAKPAEQKAAAPLSAEKNSFQQVTARLDSGGSLYVYLGTEQWLDGLSTKIAGWRKVAGSLPIGEEQDRQNIGKGLDILTRLIHDCGVEEVSGVGMSSFAVENGLYRTKFFLHHYPGKGNGFLWSVLGQKPHPLAGLGLLSTNTALAAFSDLDLAMLWSVIQKQVSQAGFPQAQEMLNQLPEGFEKATGLKWDQVLASLGGEYGVALSLDAVKVISLPLPGGPLEIPEPSLMLAIKVKDDTIFNRVDQALQGTGMPMERVDKPNLKMRTVAVPLPLPIQLRPTIASAAGYLLLATSDAMISEALAVNAGERPGVKSTEEFQRLSKDMPTQGNHFTYMSQRLGRALGQLQSQALQSNPDLPPPVKELLASFFSKEPSFAYTVGANTDEGWYSVGYGNQGPGKVLAAAAVVPTAITAGMALPALAKAKERAQSVSCVNNLKQLGLAVKVWALDNGDKSPPGILSMTNEMGSPKILVCPSDTGRKPAENWASYSSDNCSYDYLAPSTADNQEPQRVVFRCPIHGNIGLMDGSVQMAIAKNHPDRLEERNGKLYYKSD